MAIFFELKVLDSFVYSKGLSASPISPSKAKEIAHQPKPSWFKIRPPSGEPFKNIKSLLREKKLHTVCEEAHCPNLSECWASGTATIMIGGDTCTRACRFCAVKTAKNPPPLSPEEPQNVADSIAHLGLAYIVLTMVDRDDLADGGARHMAQTIAAIKKRSPQIWVEALVSDFRGDTESIQAIVNSGVDVYAHNIETVPRLQSQVRDPRAHYGQSVATLRYAKKIAGRHLLTKTSLMVGLGESRDEIEWVCENIRQSDVDVITFGQYLRPSLSHLPIVHYLSPLEFEDLQRLAESYGFLYVASGPFVRSSYKAGEFFLKNYLNRQKGAAWN